MIEIKSKKDAAHRRFILGGEPMLYHCHHFNTFLQRSIQDADFIDSEKFLLGAAAEVSFSQLTNVFKDENVTDAKERKQIASGIYKYAGFGTLKISALEEDGGNVSTDSCHFSLAWKQKWGDTDQPVCVFSRGWLAGAMAAIYNKENGSYSVTQTKCMVKSDATNDFQVSLVDSPVYSVFKSVQLGDVTDHKPESVPDNSVDYEGVYKAITGLKLIGDSKGIISAFGVYLTKMYANYYNRISFEFMHALKEKYGDEGVEIAEPLLVESGHVCAFNTFGGIMTSPEWDGLIKPSLKTKEDWVHGIVAVINGLGWGRWQVTEVSEASATFVIHDDYESSGYLKMYGKADHNISYLAEGASAGIMNLVYYGNIESRPELNPEFYEKLFKSDDSYVTEQISSKAMGDAFTSFKVYKP